MDRVEGMMRGLKLSEAEKKGVRIGCVGSGKVGVGE
jgi:predicted homoserine dehydrogenase-like protein